jgi:hypothetical protein
MVTRRDHTSGRNATELQSRPLASRFDCRQDIERSAQCEQEEARQNSQPSEDEAEVVASGGEDDVGAGSPASS